MRTSAAVARSTTSSLVNASAPRVLSRRANSWTLIICSLIVGLSMIHRNPGFGRRILRPPCGPLRPTAGASNCAHCAAVRNSSVSKSRAGRPSRHALCHPCRPATPRKCRVEWAGSCRVAGRPHRLDVGSAKASRLIQSQQSQMLLIRTSCVAIPTRSTSSRSIELIRSVAGKFFIDDGRTAWRRSAVRPSGGRLII